MNINLARIQPAKAGLCVLHVAAPPLFLVEAFSFLNNLTTIDVQHFQDSNKVTTLFLPEVHTSIFSPVRRLLKNKDLLLLLKILGKRLVVAHSREPANAGRLDWNSQVSRSILALATASFGSNLEVE